MSRFVNDEGEKMMDITEPSEQPELSSRQSQVSLVNQPHYCPLYGGAVESILPSSLYQDVSTLREVPDHQEVFLHITTEASLITELLDLEKSASVTDDNIIEYYFDELGKDNEATQSQLLWKCSTPADTFMPSIGGGSYHRMFCVGKQLVTKYRSQNTPTDYVYIFLVLVRLRNVETDLLIQLNIPFKEERMRSLESSLQASVTSMQQIDDLFGQSLPSSHGQPHPMNELLMMEDHSLNQQLLLIESLFPEVKDFQTFLYYLRIQDWSLFL
jgi:hypothetical protein